MKIAAIIVAAGRGTRAGAGVPKQWRRVAGAPVAHHTVAAFQHHPRIDRCVLVIHADDRHPDRALSPGLGCVELVDGGASRDASVQSGLEALAASKTPPDLVLIHDVARPLVSATVIDAVIDALATAPGAAPALPVSDALWRGENQGELQGELLGERALVTGTQPRDGLYRAQTPQGFHFDKIRAAHHAHPGGAADDVEVARAAGLDVTITQGSEANLKITTPEDFSRAERLLRDKDKEKQMDIRLGNGFDVHAFTDGDHVILCGMRIPHDRALRGHSDADVGMHALTDAIYGALAQGDIGQHFPPSDPQWKGAASDIFLRHAVALARDKGYALSNVDVTLICEFPKIGPHAAGMRACLADIMGLEIDRVSVKATTSERLGFTGRSEGIAAIASATLIKG